MENPISYDQAKSALWRIYRDTLVKPCVEAIFEALDEGEDENEAAHQAVDNALTYYKDQYLTIFCSESSGAFFDEMGGTAIEGDSEEKIIGQLAYFNLMADVMDEYHHQKENMENENE